MLSKQRSAHHGRGDVVPKIFVSAVAQTSAQEFEDSPDSFVADFVGSPGLGACADVLQAAKQSGIHSHRPKGIHGKTCNARCELASSNHAQENG